MRVDVAIVGAGIAGLATAFELQKRGVSFVVFDSRTRPGGVILSEDADGYTIDAGPDSLLTQKPDGIRLCTELGLADRLVPTLLPRLAFIQRGGRLHALPAGSVLGIPTRFAPFAMTRLFSWSGKLRMGRELFVPPRRDTGDESIGAFIRRRFGDEAVDYLAEPLLAGIHAGDVDRLSIRALFPRLVEAEAAHGSLLRAFRRGPSAPPSPDGVFRSLPGGLSELVAAVTKALPAAALRLGTCVTSVGRMGARATERGSFRVETGDTAVEANAVVMAAPAYVTSRLVHELNPRLAALCGEVPYASTGTVALAFRRDAVRHRLAGSGFVVPRVEGTGILAASWLSSKWPHRAPAGKALMRTFVGGARDPHALEHDDRELVARSVAALRPLLGITGEPEFSRVYRFERASAQHEVGHLERMSAIGHALSDTQGLFVTGSGFRGVGIPDCVADARATAAGVATWLSECRPAH